MNNSPMKTVPQKENSRLSVARRMAQGFVLIPGGLLLEVAIGNIEPGALYVYAYLLFRQGTNPTTWVGKEEIAWGTGYSLAQVGRHLANLEDCEHLSRERRYGSSSVSECKTRVMKNRRILYRGKENVDLSGLGEQAYKILNKAKPVNAEPRKPLPSRPPRPEVIKPLKVIPEFSHKPVSNTPTKQAEYPEDGNSASTAASGEKTKWKSSEDEELPKLFDDVEEEESMFERKQTIRFREEFWDVTKRIDTKRGAIDYIAKQNNERFEESFPMSPLDEIDKRYSLWDEEDDLRIKKMIAHGIRRGR